MDVLGIDVGGSGIKGALVNTETGELSSDRIRIATPKSSTPEKIAGVVGELVGRFEYRGPVGCSFPTVIVDGQAFADKIDVDAMIHVAKFRNNAGIVGAAIAAQDRR